MKRVEVAKLFETPEQFIGNNLTVCGWAKTLRVSKGISFIELNDGSCFRNLQVVAEENMPGYAEVTRQNNGCALVVRGVLVATPDSKQPFELKATDIAVEGTSSPDYPLQKKRHSLEFLRTMTHLRPRTNTLGAVYRLRSVVSYAIHKFFTERGFIHTHSPIITGSDCEGAGEMFRVTTLDAKNPPLTESGEVDFSKDFFARTASLTVSGQLEAEAFALCYGKVYNFGPTFRAENSNTPIHASEFWMIEPEIAFADLSDDMQLAQDMMVFIVKYVLEQCPDELAFFNEHYDNGLLDRLNALINADFKVCEYTEAIDLLKNSGLVFEYPVYWGCDLQKEHERWLTETHFNAPVFLINYPKEIKSFYMRLNDDGKTVAAMDLLVPGVGELIGGSQREERLDVLERRMAECGLDKNDYGWYLDLRRYGGTKHAGFGLGLERLLLYLTCVGNIRDVLLFPRTPKTLV